MSTQTEEIEKLIGILKMWQRIENESILNTTEIIKKTKNPLVKFVMEIIRQDSAMHNRIQQFIVDNFEKNPISVFPSELNDYWELVKHHEELEEKTVELAHESMEGTTSIYSKYLLNYLLTDEKKHVTLVKELEKIKNGEYPYGSIK